MEDKNKESKIYTYVGLCVAIASMIMYMFVSYYMFGIAKLLFNIGNVLLGASSIIFACFGYKQDNKVLTLVNMATFCVSITIMISLIFEIVRNYIF